MKTKFKGSEDKWECVFTSDKKRGVRNKGGMICILYHPIKYSGQDERYDLELVNVILQITLDIQRLLLVN